VETLAVARGTHRIHAEVVPGRSDREPVVLMHGFPDNLHLYDRLLPHLVGRVPVVLRAAARAVVRTWPGLDRRLFTWQVGEFIRDEEARGPLVAQLYEQFRPVRPAFWRLNDDLLTAVLTRRRRLPALRAFTPPVRVIFGARDRYLNPRLAHELAALFPNSELHLLPDAGHYVQVDEARRVADLLTE
jgi:haloalkane dehalogenase